MQRNSEKCREMKINVEKWSHHDTWEWENHPNMNTNIILVEKVARIRIQILVFGLNYNYRIIRSPLTAIVFVFLVVFLLVRSRFLITLTPFFFMDERTDRGWCTSIKCYRGMKENSKQFIIPWPQSVGGLKGQLWGPISPLSLEPGHWRGQSSP